VRRRAVVSALLAALLTGALSACGRKGELQPPPSGKAPPDEPPVGPEAQDPVEPEAQDE
jgi:predicted small lipoprotein YifL